MKEAVCARPNRDNPRDRILHAAATLFAHQGYAATSTREIIEAAAVTKPTLYHHFKSKKKLYLTILGEAMKVFQDRLNLSVAGADDMRASLRSLFLGIEDFVRDHSDRARLINGFLFGPLSGIPCGEFHESRRIVEAILGDLLRRGVENGEILDNEVESVLPFLLGMLLRMQKSGVNGMVRDEVSGNHYVGALDLILPKARSV